jgi:ATP-binding cassette subfamily C protein
MAAVPGVRRSELGDALRACRSAFIGVGAMSCMINLLYLTGSIFMLEIYDRVLPSRSVPTLVGLVILAGGLYIAQGFLDLIRGRILGRIGTSLDEALNNRVFETVVRLPLMVGGRNEGLQPLRDLDNVRSFLGSMGPGAFFDLPWLPFYLAICFAFHVLIGLTALVRAVILFTLTLVTEFMSREPARRRWAGGAPDLAASSRRNAEVLVAMGMAGRLTKRWSEPTRTIWPAISASVSPGSRRDRQGHAHDLQSAVLAVGAYLVIHQEATAAHRGFDPERAGAAPVDLATPIGKASCRAAELATPESIARSLPAQAVPTLLQSPERPVEGVSIVPPGDQRIIVQDVVRA